MSSRCGNGGRVGACLGGLFLVIALCLEAQNSRLNLQRESVSPFQIFDNVYYVGTSWVSCYAVTTSEGVVLIDALYGHFPRLAVENLEALGLGGRKIAYVLVTHGHWDHAGGAAYFQDEVGAKVGMTAADWDLAIRSATQSRSGFFTGGVPKRELVLSDEQVLVVGETTFRCYVTPGHTKGVLSLEFPARDGKSSHRAFVFGGVGLNFSGVGRTESYLESVARIRILAKQEPPISVFLSNHPAVGMILDHQARLRQRTHEGKHPFVNASGFITHLDGFQRAAEEKLKQERGQ